MLPSSVTETNVQQKLHLQRNRLQRFHNNALPHSYVVTTTLGPVRVETINMLSIEYSSPSRYLDNSSVNNLYSGGDTSDDSISNPICRFCPHFFERFHWSRFQSLRIHVDHKAFHAVLQCSNMILSNDTIKWYYCIITSFTSYLPAPMHH